MKEFFSKEGGRYASLSLITIFALALRLVNLNQSFWLDEAAQVIESARPLSQQLHIVSDFHPPGFHLLLHFWMLVSHSEVWIRFLSVIFSLGSIIGVYAIGKRIADEKTGLLAALFLSINPYHLWYSQDTRPYMMLVFFATLSLYFLLTKRWKLYTVALVGSWYSTYFAPFVFLGHALYIIMSSWLSFAEASAEARQGRSRVQDRNEVTRFLCSHILAFLLFIPWIPSFLQQLSVGTSGFFSGWTDVVSMVPVKASLMTFAKFIFGRGSIDNNFFYAAVILPVFLFFLFSCWQSLKTHSGKVLFTIFWVPFLASVLVTFIVPVLAPQRLTFMLPIFTLLLALGVLRIRKPYQWLAIAGIVVTSMVGVAQYYSDPSVQREQWKEAVRSIESEAPPQSMALFVFSEPFAPYLWYQNGSVPGMGIAPMFTIRGVDLAHLGSDTLPQVSRVYFFQYLTGLTDPKGDTRQYVSERGFHLIDQKNFEGVGFVYVYERL